MALRGLDLREDVGDLADLASRDLAALWRQVANAAEAETALRDILPALIDTYGLAAAAVAAEWYDDLRFKVGVGGSFTALTATIPEAGSQALVGWALAEATDLSSFQSLVEGGVQRRIANFARKTVIDSTLADPRADGWQRVTVGGCAFCQMVAGRGTLYRSEDSASFGSHDRCRCAAVPAWGGEPVPVKPYKPSSRNISDADRARARAWMREHLPDVRG